MQSETAPVGTFVRKPETASIPPLAPSNHKHTVERGVKTPRVANFFETLITVSLVALFFGLPIFFTGMTFQGISFEKQMYFYVWLLIGIVAWASHGVITGEMRIRRTPLDIPIFVFLIAYILAAAFSVDRWHSFFGSFGDPSRGVIAVGASVLAYYFIMSHFNPKRFLFMFWSFVVSGYIVTLWSALVVMGVRFVPASFEGYMPMSLMGTVSALGIFLGLLLPLFVTGIFMLWKEEQIKSRFRKVATALLLIGIVLAMFLILVLYPFVSWVVVLGGFSFFLVYILAQIVRPAEQWAWVPMLVFVGMLAFLMIGSNGLARATLPVEVSPNAALSWQVAKASLASHFLVGSGPAEYGYAFSMFRPQEYNENALYTLRFYQGMGLVFEAIATIGAVGSILLIILFLAFLSVGLYLMTYEKQRNKIRSLGLWTASIMLLLAACVAPINGVLLAIGTLLAALSFAVLLWESGSEERYFQLSFKASPKFALALAFIFMVVSAGVAFIFVFLGKVFVADIEAGKAVRMSAVQPSRESAALLSRAAGLYPQESRYYARLAQEYISLANQEYAKPDANRDTNAIAFYVREAVKAGEQSRQLMPNDAMTVESLALIYENSALYASDALSKAEELYARAHDLEPHNALYLLKLGQIKKTIGDAKQNDEQKNLYNEAKDFFEQAIAEKGDLASAHYNLAIVLSRLDDTDQAINEALKALSLDRSNLNYQYNLGALYQFRYGDGDAAKAEMLFKNILDKNDKLVDVRLSLGLLYERESKKDAAIVEYQKVVDLIPADSQDAAKQTRDQVLKLISNVRNGISNVKKADQAAVSDTAIQAPAVPQDNAGVPAAGMDAVGNPATNASTDDVSTGSAQ
jgi:tetratricopeptide (TPR) repeat protein